MARRQNPMRAIKAAITRFDEAARSDAFKGAGDPDNYEYIEDEYRRARECLEALIERNLKGT